MIAWVWPESTVRSTPFRISLGPSSVATETCRSLISKVDMCVSTPWWLGAAQCGVSGAGDGQLDLDRLVEPLPQLGDRDLAEDLAEEAADDEPAGHVLRDAA